LTPALGELADMGTEAFSWAAEFIEQNPWLVQALTAVAAALGVLVAGVIGLQIIGPITKLIADFNLVLSANPIIAVAAAITGLVVVFGSLKAGANEAREAHEELMGSIEESADAHSDAAAELEKEKASVQALADSLQELSAKENKSAADKAMLREYVEQLNTSVPALALAYDEETDSITSLGGATGVTTAAIEAMINEQYRQAEVNLLTERAVQLRQEMAAAEEAVAAALERQQAAQSANPVGGGVGASVNAEGIAADTDLAEAQSALVALQAEYDAVLAKIEALTGAQGEYANASAEVSAASSVQM